MKTEIQKLQLAVEALQFEVKTSPAAEGRISDMLASVLVTANRVFGLSSDKFKEVEKNTDFKSNDTYRKITPTNYFDFSQRQIEAAPGFQGRYLDYGTHLQASLKYRQDVEESLTFYRQLLGTIINSTDARKSWVSVSPRINASVKRRDDLQKDEAAYWGGDNGGVSLTIVGNCISRVSDLPLLDKQASDVSATLKGAKISEINEQIRHIVDLANAVAEDVRNGKLPGITTQQVINMGSGVLDLAHQCELFGVICYNAETYLAMVSRLQQAANEVV